MEVKTTLILYEVLLKNRILDWPQSHFQKFASRRQGEHFLKQDGHRILFLHFTPDRFKETMVFNLYTIKY